MKRSDRMKIIYQTSWKLKIIIYYIDLMDQSIILMLKITLIKLKDCQKSI